jgi:conjugal transfer/type IV secretion protein DotA/TraY
VKSLFPTGASIGTTTTATSTGSEATVIGQIIGQFTGFVAAIACAFVCYNTIMTIHRAAESSQILGSNQSWIFVVRVGFAAIMMYPLGSGFSGGQELVEQGALWGVGMAKALYTNAVQAVGPDAMIIAQPVIPGTGDIVAGSSDPSFAWTWSTSKADRPIPRAKPLSPHRRLLQARR